MADDSVSEHAHDELDLDSGVFRALAGFMDKHSLTAQHVSILALTSSVQVFVYAGGANPDWRTVIEDHGDEIEHAQLDRPLELWLRPKA